MSPLHRFSALTAAAACALAVSAAPAVADPTLDNESVLGLTASNFRVEAGSFCNPDGSGQINFSESGTASGAFPGSYQGTGSVTLGPKPSGNRAPVTAFSNSFTIDSGATSITGTATLGEPADTLRWGFYDFVNRGECLNGPFTANQFNVGLRYTATITDPGGTFADNGYGQSFGAENRFLSPNTLMEAHFGSLAGATAPGAPTSVIAAAGDGQAVVTWANPAANGNPIRDFVVTADPGGQTMHACTALSTDVTCHSSSVVVPGLTNNVAYTFAVTAVNAVGAGPASSPSAAVTPGAGQPLPGLATASPTQSTTVSGGDFSLNTQLTVPAGTAGGLVSLTQSSTLDPAPAGFSFLGQQLEIVAPAATAENPLVLAFTIDDDVLAGAGVDASTVQIFRDGVAIAPCDPPGSAAVPDPCVASRSGFGGEAHLLVFSSHASTWNFGTILPYDIAPFQRPVDDLPTLNAVKAGAAVPVKFTLGGDRGLSVFADGYPRSAMTSCSSSAPVDAIEQTVSAGHSSLSYDVATDVYTYTWKTDKSWPVPPAGPCRQLVLAFADGSTMRANFRFAK